MDDKANKVNQQFPEKDDKNNFEHPSIKSNFNRNTINIDLILYEKTKNKKEIVNNENTPVGQSSEKYDNGVKISNLGDLNAELNKEEKNDRTILIEENIDETNKFLDENKRLTTSFNSNKSIKNDNQTVTQQNDINENPTVIKNQNTNISKYNQNVNKKQWQQHE